MAAGDIKGPEAVVIKVTAGAAVTKGQLVHLEADGKWDPTVDTDTGKFGVACEAASADGVEFLCCIFGRVEVTASAAAIAKGSYVEADAGVVKAAALTAYGEVVGFAMEAFASGETKTIWVGVM
jgi:hypothetical protein